MLSRIDSRRIKETLWPIGRLRITGVAGVWVGLVGLLVGLGGCVAEDHFCDDLACYVCDGISCRTVDPPGRTSCRGDFECPAGTICTSIGCVATCSAPDASGVCPEGTTCREGEDLCLGPSEPTPNRTPGTCEGPEDCPDFDTFCLNGFCALLPNACETNANCAPGQRCVDNQCKAEQDICQFSLRCEAGLDCVNARCVASCDGGCDAGLVCDPDGFCRVDPNPGECVTEDDCAAGEVCVDTRCVAECSPGGSECAADEYCDDGRCRFDDRPAPPFCVNDDDCRTGRRCVEGVCRTPCNSDNDCVRVDDQFRFCINRLCVTTNEATSNCFTNSECDEGDSCIDGVCR